MRKRVAFCAAAVSALAVFIVLSKLLAPLPSAGENASPTADPGPSATIRPAAPAPERTDPPPEAEISIEIEDEPIEEIKLTKPDKTGIVEGAAEYIKLSHAGFFYDNDISVGITFEMEGIDGFELRYTLNGSYPSFESALYEAPLEFRKRRGTLVAAECLRVRAFYTVDGTEFSTGALTHTYFVSETVASRFQTLVFAVTADPYWLYDYKDGIFVEGKIRDEFLKANPGTEIVYWTPANFTQRGRQSEREAYLEVFEPDGTRVISQGAGLRVHGSGSRIHEQKSLRLIARKEYDSKSAFDYPFFKGLPPKSAYSGSYKSISDFILRNSANDASFNYVRDELSAVCALAAGFPSVMYWRQAAVFLNGRYYGYAWQRERHSKESLRRAFGAPDDNFAILELADLYGDEQRFTLQSGPESALDDYNEVKELIKKDMRNDDNYARLCSLVDIDNLALYYAIEIYAGNGDWPHNNCKVWKYCGGGGDNEYLDGRWRFLLYDMDMTWGSYGGTANGWTFYYLNEGSFFLRALFKRPEFNAKFFNALCDLANDSFSSESAFSVLAGLYELQDAELRIACETFKGSYLQFQTILENRKHMDRFVRERPAETYAAIERHFPEHTETYRVTLEGSDGMAARLNTIPVNGEDRKSAVYYVNYNIPVSASETSGKVKFSHWVVNGVEYYDRDLILTPEMRENGEIYVRLATVLR